MKNLKAAKKEALSYIEPTIRYCFTDCCDSMHESERYCDRFNAVTNDKIDIKDFIEKNLLNEYAKAWLELKLDYDLCDTDAMHPSVCKLPIPYEKFKHLLKN